jgi:F-type H+-transporting ATPase subunit delta
MAKLGQSWGGSAAARFFPCGIPYTCAWLMCPAAHGMRGAEGDAGGIERRRFLIGPADAKQTGLPYLFPGENDHVSSDDPMMASMAGRYAVALFELAKDQRQLEQVERDLTSFQAMLDGSADLRRLVLSPVITAEDQAKGLAAVLQMAGISGLTANFVMLIARNRRLFAAADMMKAFRALIARERGEVSADVASAHALSPEQLQLLSDTLRTSIGKNVRIDTRVDPGLLGGLVVKVGSRMIDSSLRTKLNNLKVVMKGIG